MLQDIILSVTHAFYSRKLEFFQLFSRLLLKLCQTHRHMSWSVEPGQPNLVSRTWSVEPGQSNLVSRTWTAEVPRAKPMRSACTHPARTTRYHVRAPTGVWDTRSMRTHQAHATRKLCAKLMTQPFWCIVYWFYVKMILFVDIWI